ncbi:MAG: hypothetical protein U9R74_03535 [Pseudomonadota bacterium]|nr:hypothetical protein [Pseudomonadota bacterium]
MRNSHGNVNAFFQEIHDAVEQQQIDPGFLPHKARVYHYVKVLEALTRALDPQISTSILSVSETHDLLEEAAATIQTDLPVVSGTIPERPKGVTDQLREIAASLRGRSEDPASLLLPDARLSDRLDVLLHVEILPMVELSLEDRATDVVETYIRP